MLKEPGTLEEKFWRRVNKGSPGECWEWQGRTNNFGYGMLSLIGKKSILAHRLSWQIEHGPIPEGLCCLHHCDNPRCVNPAHLFLGTMADNTHDMDSKGRGRRPHFVGSSHPRAKLTEKDVPIIRRLSKGGVGRRSLAKRFGVGRMTITHLLRGDTWRHVAEEL